jgi:hypothetical protein
MTNNDEKLISIAKKLFKNCKNNQYDGNYTNLLKQYPNTRKINYKTRQQCKEEVPCSKSEVSS